MSDSDWLTKVEAAKQLGCSTRTLERYVSKGRLATGRRDTPNGAQLMIDAASLEALRADLESKKQPSDVVSSDTPSTTIAKRADMGLSQTGYDALITALTQMAPKAPSVPIADRLILGLREAAEVSMLSRRFLIEALKAGTLKGSLNAWGRGWRVKRADLDAFIEGL